MNQPEAISEIPSPVTQPISSHEIGMYLVMAGIWLCGIGWTWTALNIHTFRPEQTVSVIMLHPEKQPQAIIPKSRIVMFAHPLCPCTRASLIKLGEVALQVKDQSQIRVVFVTRGLNPEDVTTSKTLALARQLKHVTTELDESGTEECLYQATVSGEVFAFDAQGERIFHGGLTSGRGHLGVASSQEYLEQLITGKATEPLDAAVYGCRLPK
jgi:hypothetical protein